MTSSEDIFYYVYLTRDETKYLFLFLFAFHHVFVHSRFFYLVFILLISFVESISFRESIRYFS